MGCCCGKLEERVDEKFSESQITAKEIFWPDLYYQRSSILGNPGLQRGRDGKGETESRKKVGGGEGKGKRKGEALGSFSIQIISRSITFLSRYWPHF